MNDELGRCLDLEAEFEFDLLPVLFVFWGRDVRYASSVISFNGALSVRLFAAVGENWYDCCCLWYVSGFDMMLVGFKTTILSIYCDSFTRSAVGLLDLLFLRALRLKFVILDTWLEPGSKVLFETYTLITSVDAGLCLSFLPIDFVNRVYDPCDFGLFRSALSLFLASSITVGLEAMGVLFSSRFLEGLLLVTFDCLVTSMFLLGLFSFLSFVRRW